MWHLFDASLIKKKFVLRINSVIAANPAFRCIFEQVWIIEFLDCLLQGTMRGGYGGGHQSSPYATMGGGHSPNYSFNANGTMSPGSSHSLSFEGALEATLINSPPVHARDAFNSLYRPRSFAEKARINAGYVVNLLFYTRILEAVRRPRG